MEIDLPRMQSLSPPLDSPPAIDPFTDLTNIDALVDMPSIKDVSNAAGSCDLGTACNDLDLCGCKLLGKSDCGCRYINQVGILLTFFFLYFLLLEFILCRGYVYFVQVECIYWAASINCLVCQNRFLGISVFCAICVTTWPIREVFFCLKELNSFDWLLQSKPLRFEKMKWNCDSGQIVFVSRHKLP